jgi:hypothetical protein
MSWLVLTMLRTCSNDAASGGARAMACGEVFGESFFFSQRGLCLSVLDGSPFSTSFVSACRELDSGAPVEDMMCDHSIITRTSISYANGFLVCEYSIRLKLALEQYHYSSECNFTAYIALVRWQRESKPSKITLPNGGEDPWSQFYSW